MTATTTQNRSVVDRFLTGIETGLLTSDLYASDAILDATVPGWRFQVHGPDAILKEYASWFSGPCRVQLTERHPLPDGELIRYVQDYDLDAASFTTHHLHLVTVHGDQIRRDVVFCGGRWGADTLAKMGAAAHAG